MRSVHLFKCKLIGVTLATKQHLQNHLFTTPSHSSMSSALLHCIPSQASSNLSVLHFSISSVTFPLPKHASPSSSSTALRPLTSSPVSQRTTEIGNITLYTNCEHCLQCQLTLQGNGEIILWCTEAQTDKHDQQLRFTRPRYGTLGQWNGRSGFRCCCMCV